MQRRWWFETCWCCGLMSLVVGGFDVGEQQVKDERIKECGGRAPLNPKGVLPEVFCCVPLLFLYRSALFIFLKPRFGYGGGLLFFREENLAE